MASSNKDSITFKLAIVGNSGVGKTQLVSRYINDDFSKAYIPSIRKNVQFKDMEMDGY